MGVEKATSLNIQQSIFFITSSHQLNYLARLYHTGTTVAQSLRKCAQNYFANDDEIDGLISKDTKKEPFL